MYSSTHQRSSSNPRAYTTADPLSGRRDDTAGQSMYGGEDSYGAYQHAGGYSSMGNVGGYGGYSSGVNLAGYGTTTSPSAPSGSRRTSGPKHNTPPQASAPATNPSPSSRYYQTAQPQNNADAAGHHQSPYQPSSAPPQVLNHHHSGMGSQPQTAHPYASQYHNYYDQHQGQWANYPSAAGQGGYAQQSAAPRSSTTQSTTTPTVPQSATLGDSHQQQQPSHRSSATGSSAYDYSGATGAYQSWPPHDQSRGSSGQQQPQQSWQQAPQTGSSRSSQSQGSQAAMMQQGGWQGYGGHPSMPQTMPPHHMASAHMPPGGQYGWQQQQQWGSSGYGYPPAPAPHTQPVHTQPAQSAPPPVGASASAAAATSGKKSKKEKHEKVDKHDLKAEKAEKKAEKAAAKAAEKAEKAEKKHKKDKSSSDYKGLGKRHVESSTEEEADEKKEGGKKRKGKKHDEEKPAHKAPAKSHLHPPRQAQSAWQLFFTDELNKAKAAAAQGNSPGGTPHHAKLNVAQIAKDAGTAYASLNEEQKKYYAQKVIESKEQYARELAVWQATLTPEDIKAENAFRAQQRKEGKSRKGNLKDPNAPKKPLSAYFLFLKGIRENDDIRAKVWGDESETTKQSVLAAERWRSLSDEEKKPYLQQAEHDKQEYEAARKIYEDDAAARARGEVPTHPAGGSDPVTGVKGEENNNDGESGEHHYPLFPSSDPVKASSSPVVNDVKYPSSEPNFPDFQQGDSRGSASNIPAQQGEERRTIEHSSDDDDDEFQGFTDPLEEMELAGLENMTGAGESHEPQWDELQRLMGTTDDGYDEKAEEGGVKETGDSAEGVSVAPALSEAAGSTDLQTQSGTSEAQVQQIAAQAEGLTAVPQLATSSALGSGVPTEAVGELPPAGVPVADANGAGSAEVYQSQPQGIVKSNLPAADGV
ncbi:hypothetical protein I317_04011 [Kwoniella heveanensis CBS 569]|nr:hypothetical protein I317_04011 [Kwoniella heveanensis CBS 569]